MGAKRERREVGELRRVGSREEWGREKNGVEKGKGTHAEAGQEGEEGGLRWGGAGAGQEEGGRAAASHSSGLAGALPPPPRSLLQQEDEQGWPGIICLHYTIPTSSSLLARKLINIPLCLGRLSSPPALPPGWPLLPPGCVLDLLVGTPPSSTPGALLPPSFFLPCPLSSGRFSGYVPWRWGRCLGESTRPRARSWCDQPLQESS